MKLRKFNKKIDKANDAHFEATGEYFTSDEIAQAIVEMADARDEAGKDSSAVYNLIFRARCFVNAHNALEQAEIDFDNVYECLVNDAISEV